MQEQLLPESCDVGLFLAILVMTGSRLSIPGVAGMGVTAGAGTGIAGGGEVATVGETDGIGGVGGG